MEDTAKQIQIAYQEHYYLILGIRIGAGILFGSIPLILGIKKKKRNLAFLTFIISVIVGTLAPVLLIIALPIFIWLILRKPKTVETGFIDAEIRNENAIDVSVENPENS